MKKLERDTMPADAAIESLLHDRLTNTQRKFIASQRWTIWAPDLERTEDEQQEYDEAKLKRKLSRATAAQLLKWRKRTDARRTRLQRQAEKLQAERVNQEAALQKAEEQDFQTMAQLIRKRLQALVAADRVLSARAELMDTVWCIIVEIMRARGIKL